MPYVRVAHQMHHVRPSAPHPIVGHPRMSGGYPRAPIVNRNHHNLPRHLPVLQPPFFPRQSDPYEDDFEQELDYDEFYPDPTAPIPDQRRLYPSPLIHRLLAYPLFSFSPYMYYRQ